MNVWHIFLFSQFFWYCQILHLISTTGFALKHFAFGWSDCAGKSSFEMDFETGSNDIAEYSPHYDQPSIGMIFCCILCSHLFFVGPESCRIGHPVCLLFWTNFETFWWICLRYLWFVHNRFFVSQVLNALCVSEEICPLIVKLWVILEFWFLITWGVKI